MRLDPNNPEDVIKFQLHQESVPLVRSVQATISAEDLGFYELLVYQFELALKYYNELNEIIPTYPETHEIYQKWEVVKNELKQCLGA